MTGAPRFAHSRSHLGADSADSVGSDLATARGAGAD